MVYNYYKNRKRVAGPPPEVRAWPRDPATAQLPIYNERYVIERLVEAVVAFDYPRELLEIQVLDDSTDDTHQVPRHWSSDTSSPVADRLYPSRQPRRIQSGSAAGRVDVRARRICGDFRRRFYSSGGFFAADRAVLHRYQLAMVQTRWSYINRHYSALTEVEAILLDGHFVIEHERVSAAGCFSTSTAGRNLAAKMIEDAGGWQHDTLTEDTDLLSRAIEGLAFRIFP